MSRLATIFVALVGLAISLPSSASFGINSARPRGITYTNARAIHPYQNGNSDSTNLDDDVFWLATSLANPIWRAAANAQVTAFAIPKETGTYRVRISSTSRGYDSGGSGVCIDNAASGNNCITACFKNRTAIGDAQDVDGTCNVTANTRVDFILGGGTDIANRKGPNLAQGTRYFYVLERLESGGTWSRQPEYSFMTMSGTASADQHFAYIGDEHSPALYGVSVCGTEVGTGARKEWDLFLKTLDNILVNNITHNYLFYMTDGDNATTHTKDPSFNPCENQMGKSPHLDEATLGLACATQNECDARWIIYLRTVQPIIKYIPLVLTLGNHEGETQYAQAVTGMSPFTGLTGGHGYWWFNSTNSLEFYSRTARYKYMPSAAYTYDGTTGDPDGATIDTAFGRYYSLASASFELIIGDIEGGPGNNLDGDGTVREWPDDFPGSCNPGIANERACTISLPARGWNDWTYGGPQCGFLTGLADTTCSGATGRWGAATGLVWETLTVKWKMLTSHHSAGSNTRYNDNVMYGRGGMGNTVRTCVGGTELAGAQCSVAVDCYVDPENPLSVPTDCGGISGANPLGTLNGSVQANLQAKAEAFNTASGGKSFFLYGHDHFSACAQKYKAGPTATGVFYCDVTQPGGLQQGPNWTDNYVVVVSYDWGGKSNGADGLPDYCTPTTRTAMAVANDKYPACNGLDSANSFGSTLRGYIDVRVNGTTSVVMTQRATILPSETELLALEPNNSIEWTMTAP